MLFFAFAIHVIQAILKNYHLISRKAISRKSYPLLLLSRIGDLFKSFLALHSRESPVFFHHQSQHYKVQHHSLSALPFLKRLHHLDLLTLSTTSSFTVSNTLIQYICIHNQVAYPAKGAEASIMRLLFHHGATLASVIRNHSMLELHRL